MSTGSDAGELSAAELEQQGTYAHATRNWVFLHGTASQFAAHTQRMLALEQEYVRRFPRRTWQGGTHDAAPVDEATRLRQALRGIQQQIDALLGGSAADAEPAPGPHGDVAGLLDALRAAGGRMHKLELHQVAREHGIGPAELAALYRGARPALAADRDERVLVGALTS